ncbi:MAG: S1-like domain-containing RNA-binding protein [Crocinitomicaceae bacterium]|nr:S1-like domain-containing RNA-binding protein [Crocinitomicaceae bacterium]
MIEVGKYNELEILRSTSVGLYLGDEEGNDVLLPNKYCPDKYELGDKLKVFVYRDHEERKVATDIEPKIFLNQFAFLKVSSVSKIGAFLDWGMEKELLVPFSEQRQKMEEDRWYVVKMLIDKETDRLYATNKTDRHISNENIGVELGEKVELLISRETELGFMAIINHAHEGLLYDSDIYQDLRVGEEVTGYIKKIRDDKKIDLSLQPQGYRNFIDQNTERVFTILQENGGFMPYNDKSDPDDIADEFGLSKKAFKKAIGALYKSRMIIISPKGIEEVK